MKGEIAQCGKSNETGRVVAGWGDESLLDYPAREKKERLEGEN